jgi:RNA methyltransferase, TrmH family
MLVKSQVKYIQSLSQKKFRDEEGVFVAEGPKIINELLAGQESLPVAIYGTDSWFEEHKAVAGRASARLPAGAGVPVAGNAAHQPPGDDLITLITAVDLERISFLTTPNQVLGVFKKPVARDISNIFSDTLRATTANAKARLVLVLDGIQDPGNLGTIIRCADWFGIEDIVCSYGCADNFSPKVVQSTMASIVRVNVIYTDLVKFLTGNPQIPVYAAALDGKSLNEFRTDDGLAGNNILIIGNESKGISPEIMSLASHRITIPRHGRAESLNAAVATGILLSALRR